MLNRPPQGGLQARETVEMVGMRDVAKKAGVSVSTVSLVVNQSGYVSDEMRARVEKSMHELNYIPNELARNLYRGRTNLIGFIVPSVRHPFFSTLTASVQHALTERGLRTMMCSTVDMAGGETEYVDMLRRHMMDGIVMGAHTTHKSDYWTSIGRPIVAFDRYLGLGIASVGSDHEQGGKLIADTLLRSGARHVAMVGGPRSQFHDLENWMADTERSKEGDIATTFPTVRYHALLEQELESHGVKHDYIEAGEVDDLRGYAEAMRHVCDRVAAGEIDAVVSSDIGAAFCVQEALRRGIRIPQDLQIIAYDGTYLVETAGMKITAVRQDFDALGELIAARMVEAVQNSADEQHASQRVSQSQYSHGSNKDNVLNVSGDGASSSGEGDEADSCTVGVTSDVVPVHMIDGETVRTV